MLNAIDFFGPVELGIVELLIGKDLYVRGIAKELGVAPSTVCRAVKKLAGHGIVVFLMEQNRKIVSLNRQNFFAKQAVSLLLAFKIADSRAFKELKKNSLAIGLYGSAAEGTVDRLSDIDLWAVFKEKQSAEKIGRIKNLLSKELGREVSIKAFTKESLEKLKQNDKIFFDEIRYKSKILQGEQIE